MTNHHATYSRAVEEQLALWEWVNTTNAQELLRLMLSGGVESEAAKRGIRRVNAVLERILKYGETYYWTAELCKLLEYSADTMPDWTLTVQSVPCQNGFIWFEKPLEMPLDIPYVNQKVTHLRNHIRMVNHEIQAANREMDEVVAAASDKLGGKLPRKGGGWLDEDVRLNDAGQLVPHEKPFLNDIIDHEHPDVAKLENDLVDIGVRLTRANETLQQYERELEGFRSELETGEQRDLQAMGWTLATDEEHPDSPFLIFEFFANDAVIRQRGVPALSFEWHPNEPMSQIFEKISDMAEHPDDGIVEKPDRGFACARYVAAALAFLEQEIVMPSSERPDRATRRRVAKWRPEPLVRVVRLRRVRRPDDPEHESEERDWAYRWMVRGHWRQQWYPSLGRHQAKWIGPYVKGPDDKPLKEPRAKVFAVVR